MWEAKIAVEAAERDLDVSCLPVVLLVSLSSGMVHEDIFA